MMELTDLKQQRETIKGRVTAIQKFAKRSKTASDLEQLESRKSILKELLIDFFKIHNSIAAAEKGIIDHADQVDESLIPYSIIQWLN